MSQSTSPTAAGGIVPDRGGLDDSETRQFQGTGDEASDGEIASRREEDPQSDDEDPADFCCRIEDVEVTQEFIRSLRKASIYNGDMSEDDIETLLHPPDSPLELDEEEDKASLLALRIFLAQKTASQDTYKETISAIHLAHPEYDNSLPSYDQVKRMLAGLSGVHPIVNDMCPNSCMAYTGPCADDVLCRRCSTSRYDPETGNPRQQFHTLPIGPQIQALKRHPQSAKNMDYFNQRMGELLSEHERTGSIAVIDDICCGSDIFSAVKSGKIERAKDTVLMMSFDGCQLYRSKVSDCWMYIWVVICLHPGIRYKKKYVIPGATIPGPNKPKLAESFLFPGLHHIAAIEKLGGLPIWDAYRHSEYLSQLFIVLATADGPGMVYLNGLVGHSGKIGCRLWCGLVGRHKPNSPCYYPALFKPDNYNIEGCDHEDISPHVVRGIDHERYKQHLRVVLMSQGQGTYEFNRRETGICKPSIFSGLSPSSILGIPDMFPGDIMHLILNLADLFMKLWRGKMECGETDSRQNWPWAVLTGETWTTHGRDVANATPYLPGSFDRPPRNPAEKINSGYKCWEWLLYLFGLGPGLLYNVLPTDEWESYCRLTAGIRFIYQKKIYVDKLRDAHVLLIRFITEFELNYCKRRWDRIHFVRQSLHNLQHACHEIIRLGPGACSSQWTMERTIGNLTEEMKQPSKPYANLSQRALFRAQINALYAMIPTLDKDSKTEGKLPRGSVDLGDGYVLLRAMDTCRRVITQPEEAALKDYLSRIPECDPDLLDDRWETTVVRWARLRLPNGQIARSAWKESLKPLEKVRMARNVKVILCNFL